MSQWGSGSCCCGLTRLTLWTVLTLFPSARMSDPRRGPHGHLGFEFREQLPSGRGEAPLGYPNTMPVIYVSSQQCIQNKFGDQSHDVTQLSGAVRLENTSTGRLAPESTAGRPDR